MKSFLRKYLFFIIIFFTTISIGVFEWFWIMNRCVNYKGPGKVGYFFLSVQFQSILLIMTYISETIILICLLFFKSKFDKILLKNIYISIVYMIIAIILIQLSGIF